MEIRANYILVGIFTLLVALGGVAFTLWIGSKDKGVSMTDYEILVNESVKGLSVNNDVLFTGIRVGTVSDIKISRVTPGEVRVRVTIAADTPVREDSVAQLELRGITGVSVISITGGSAQSPLMHVGEHEVGAIRYSPSTINTVMTQMPDVLASTNLMLRRIADTFSKHNTKSLTEILDSLAKVTDALAKRSDSIDETLASIEKVSKQLDQLARSVNVIVNKDVKTAAQSFSNAMKSVDSTMKSVEPGLKRFSGQGLTDARLLVAEMRNLVQTLTRVSQKIESDPRRFFFGNQVKEYKSK